MNKPYNVSRNLMFKKKQKEQFENYGTLKILKDSVIILIILHSI